MTLVVLTELAAELEPTRIECAKHLEKLKDDIQYRNELNIIKCQPLWCHEQYLIKPRPQALFYFEEKSLLRFLTLYLLTNAWSSVQSCNLAMTVFPCSKGNLLFLKYKCLKKICLVFRKVKADQIVFSDRLFKLNTSREKIP